MKRLAGIAALLAAEFSGAPAAADELAMDGGVTGVYQYARDDATDAELGGSLDLFLHLPYRSGEWLVYVEGSTAPDDDGVSMRFPNANADAGSVTDGRGNASIQVSELNYTFNVSAKSTVMLGLVDPSAWLDRSRRANDENQHFLNESFVNNATIEFPDYALGGVYRRLGDESLPEITLVITGSDGLGDLPSRSYADLFDFSQDGRGVFTGLGASWVRKRVSVRMGAWLRSDDHDVIGEEPKTDINYGAYAVLGWYADDHAIIVRGGMANERVSPAARFAAIAYERQSPVGLFGIGLARTFVTGDGPAADRADGTDAEVFLRIPILSGTAHVTPSIQYVRNLELGAAPVASGSSAVVAGLRLRWNF